jgi:hypothetical protein
MAERAKVALGVEKLEVVADMDYYDGAEVQKCEAQGITPCIPKPCTSANTKLGLFGKGRFHYEIDKNVHRCPAGQELTHRFGTVEKGRAIRYARLQLAAAVPSSPSARGTKPITSQ